MARLSEDKINEIRSHSDIVEVVYCYVFDIAQVPLHIGVFTYIAGLEQHLEYGHDCCKRKEGEQ